MIESDDDLEELRRTRSPEHNMVLVCTYKTLMLYADVLTTEQLGNIESQIHLFYKNNMEAKSLAARPRQKGEALAQELNQRGWQVLPGKPMNMD